MTAVTSPAAEALLPVADENAPTAGQPLSAVEKTSDGDEKLRQTAGRFADFCNRLLTYSEVKPANGKFPFFSILKALFWVKKAVEILKKYVKKFLMPMNSH